MNREQILIGGLTAVFCLLGLWHSDWFLVQTPKGRRMVRWFGPQKALWILRTGFLIGTAFGLLLALDILRPIQWERSTRDRDTLKSTDGQRSGM